MEEGFRNNNVSVVLLPAHHAQGKAISVISVLALPRGGGDDTNRRKPRRRLWSWG